MIYTIPPSSPLYPCTYVRVYASTPDTVTYGYTAGYTMSYVSAGVVVYGTGYYYPPYIYPGAGAHLLPVSVLVRRRHLLQRGYRRLGARRRDLRSVWRGRSRAAPRTTRHTGAWAHGGAIYGPNGGAGAFSAYNPTTGSYAHGSAVWGPDGASGNASWYNANTGVSGSTSRTATRTGAGARARSPEPNQTVHTQSQSNAQGSAGSFTSTSGAKGAGVSGAGGNRRAR